MSMGSLSVTAEPPVVVIGASTAGLFAAYRLASQGASVRVYEQAQVLGSPARTLILTGRVNDVLGYVPSQAVVNRTQTIELYSPHRSLTVRLREPDLIVERSNLVRLLAEKASAAGAQISLGRRFVGVEADGDGLAVRLESADGGRLEPVRARTLIGADGVASKVAQEVGLGGRPTIALLQARVSMPSWGRPQVTQVWFDPGETCYFYWLVPESPDSAVVGLIAESQAEARKSLDRFLEAEGLDARAYQAAQVPFSMEGLSPWRDYGKSRILLVGDAAGQVKVTTVGGVVTGLYGAEAAARAVVHGTTYRRELVGLRWELQMHLLLRRLLNRFADKDYDDLLALVSGNARHALAIHSRDRMAKLLLPVVLAQPRLLSLTARSLLRSSDGTRHDSRAGDRLATPVQGGAAGQPEAHLQEWVGRQS